MKKNLSIPFWAVVMMVVFVGCGAPATEAPATVAPTLMATEAPATEAPTMVATETPATQTAVVDRSGWEGPIYCGIGNASVPSYIQNMNADFSGMFTPEGDTPSGGYILKSLTEEGNKVVIMNAEGVPSNYRGSIAYSYPIKENPRNPYQKEEATCLARWLADRYSAQLIILGQP